MSLDNEFDRQYFATRQDQLPNLLGLESEVKLQYVLEGMFEDPEPTLYSSVSDLPGVGVVKYGHYLHTPSYLVTQAGRRIIVKAIPQHAGGVLHEVSLRWNITGFAFRPSGRFGRKVMIPGSVETATGKLVREVSGHQYGATDVKFYADGKLVLSTGRDTTLRICQVEDGKEVAALGWQEYVPQLSSNRRSPATHRLPLL